MTGYPREIRIVLVEPSHPGNIGGTARAMKTMGLESLWLVRPQRFPDPQAHWRAAQAGEIVDAARVVQTIAEATGDCALVVGTSTRERRIPWPRQTAQALAADIVAPGSDRPVAILFGREASGLTNEELQACQIHLQIPANPDYPSLNLAMAVQVVCYELYKATTSEAETARALSSWDRSLATAAEMEAFYDHLDRVLGAIGFHDAKAPRQAMTRLRRLFGRVRADETEIGMLRGILTHVEQALAGRATDGPDDADRGKE